MGVENERLRKLLSSCKAQLQQEQDSNREILQAERQKQKNNDRVREETKKAQDDADRYREGLQDCLTKRQQEAAEAKQKIEHISEEARGLLITLKESEALRKK